MSLQNPFQSLSQVCWVGQNDFRFLLANAEASFMKFLVGAVNTDTLVKQNEAWVPDNTGTLYHELFSKT